MLFHLWLFELRPLPGRTFGSPVHKTNTGVFIKSHTASWTQYDYSKLQQKYF